MTAFHVLSNDALTTVVGVSDHAEIEGTTHELYRAFRGNPRGAQLEQLRDLYVSELKRVLSEGITPSISPTFTWIQHANLWVLRVEFPIGADKPYQLVESNEFFIRRGASNRRMSRAELELALRRG